jgi:hypothetical protein
MAPLRSLLVLLILIGLISAATAVAQAPVQWYTDSGGGTVAGPSTDLRGGGAVAPLTAGPDVAAPARDGTRPDEPEASGALPSLPDSTPLTGGATAAAAAARAPAAHPATAPQAEPPDPEADAIGALPLTGLELGVIVTAGVCLLLAGAVLRPRSATR